MDPGEWAPEWMGATLLIWPSASACFGTCGLVFHEPDSSGHMYVYHKLDDAFFPQLDALVTPEDPRPRQIFYHLDLPG